MKTIANCKPSEFLKQTNRLRKAVEKWMNHTDIINIRKRIPTFTPIPPNADEAEKEKILKYNESLKVTQAFENMNAILDAALDQYPDETLEILALCCFVEPENVDDYLITDYLNAFAEILHNQAVVSFFTSLAKLGQNAT